MQREDTDLSDAASDRTLQLEEQPETGQQNGDGADAGVTSDEEKDVIREIREEIKRKVREDIKEELAKYDLNNLSSRTESVASSRDDDSGLPGVANLLPERDVKYQEAYQKMLKLDKILRKRMAREREVKRERVMLEKRIKEELEQLKNASTSRRSNDEANNTMKFLALTPSGDRHDGDNLNDEYSDAQHTSPVFPTEYLFEEGAPPGAASGSATGRSEGGGGDSRADAKHRRRDRKTAAAADAASHEKSSEGGSKDFIKRNIELAAASNDVVAMTPVERERLDALLKDLDSIPDLPEEFLESSNPYQLALTPGEGYRMSDEEARRLREIESGLTRLGSVPPPQLSARLQSASQSEMSCGLGSSGYRSTALQRIQAGQDWDLDRLGEKALVEVKEERMMSHRLEDLNSRLAMLSSEDSQGPMSAEQMSSLLSDCARSIGQSQLGTHRGLQSAASAVSIDEGDAASGEDGPADSDSTGELGVENPLPQVPPLDRSVLDRLLAEARAAGIGQNWSRPEPITEEAEEFEEDSASSDDSDDEAAGERLVLPDISLYANMSAPRTPNSGRYSAS